MYYIKLKDTFLTSDSVDFLMEQKGGSNYVVLYQILCLLTLKTGGRLAREVGEIILPYDADKIARDSKWFNKDTVLVALEFYKKLGLVFEDKDGFLQISGYEGIAGSETKWAEIKRRQRDKTKSNKLIGQCPKDVQDKSNIILESRTENIESRTDSLKDETPSSSSLIDQRLTNDRPAFAKAIPSIGFLYDHGYLTDFDCEDTEDMSRYSEFMAELHKKYDCRNIHISLKYFVYSYCLCEFKDGKPSGWKISKPISSKFALFKKCMNENCEKFKNGECKFDLLNPSWSALMGEAMPDEND